MPFARATRYRQRVMTHRLSRSVTSALLAAAFVGSCLWGTSPRAAAAASDGLERTSNPAGGSIVAGTLGGSSLADATAALLRRVHAELGSRPSVVQVAQNQRDHSVALLFTAAHGRTPFTGVAIVTAKPGSEITGAALYDTSVRFHSTVNGLVQQLGAMTTAGKPGRGARPVQISPAQPLEPHGFADGTGSIGAPAGWNVAVAGGGSALAIAPGNAAQVSYNMHFGGIDPGNPRGAMFLRTASPMARAGFHGIVSPYISDPVKAWVAIVSGMAQQRGMTPQIHIESQSDVGSGAANFTGTLGSGPKMIHFIAYAFVLPPNPIGMWTLSDTHVYVSNAELARQGETANAVLDSVRINFGAVAAQQNAIRKMFQAKFDAEIAADRQADQNRYDNTQHFLAQDRAAQEGMHRSAVAMENYSLDRAVVVDTRTGDHATVGSNFADTLVQGNPNFQKVPASGLLRGVDY